MPAAAPIAYAVLASSLLALASLRKQLADLPTLHDRGGFDRASFPRTAVHHHHSFVEHRAHAQSASSRPYHIWGEQSGFRGAEKVVRVRNPVSFTKADLNNDYYFKRADGQISNVEKGTDEKGKRDAVSFFSPTDFTKSWLAPHYIVGWRPQMQEHRCPDGSTHKLLHHVNLVRGRPEDDSRTDIEIVASYDRGAEAFRLPEGYGIPLQPGEPLYLDAHFLPPSCWADHQYRDSSGLDLVLTTARPTRLARVYGFTDDRMTMPPGGGAYEAIQSRESVGKIHADGGREIIAVHLHTHDIFDRKYFQVRGPDGAVRFESRPEATGYGPTQSFHTPAELGWPRLMLEPGLELRQHCDLTKKLKTAVYEGLTSDEEMCAMLYIVGFAEEKVSLRKAVTLSTSNGALVQLPGLDDVEAALASVAAGFRRLLR